MSGTAGAHTVGKFDIRRDPRVLPMLGEITLDLWRCVAELVDNSVDGFLSAMRAGAATEAATVLVNLPSAVSATARVHVRDNGPDMDAATLQRAVSAGWTGNDPIDSCIELQSSVARTAIGARFAPTLRANERSGGTELCATGTVFSANEAAIVGGGPDCMRTATTCHQIGRPAFRIAWPSCSVRPASSWPFRNLRTSLSGVSYCSASTRGE